MSSYEMPAIDAAIERNIEAGSSRLVFPALAPFYARMEGAGYALLRVCFGLTILTHGIPKLLGTSHGSMADPMAGSTNLINNVIGLPFAPQLAVVVMLLETIGALALTAGFLTRLFAPMFAVQMAVICFALGPTYPWVDRGFEYPLVLGVLALFLAFRGGGAFSVDARLKRQL